MNNESTVTMSNNSIIGTILTWMFAVLFIAIGVLNMFWGNDSMYGVFIFLLAFAFVPPATNLFKNVTGFSIPLYVKILLAIFIIWTAIGVGELFIKLEMMRQSFQ